MGDKDLFVVRGGGGFFVRFQANTPEMTSDPLSAARFTERKARTIIETLEALGFAATLVSLRFARISNLEKTNV